MIHNLRSAHSLVMDKKRWVIDFGILRTEKSESKNVTFKKPKAKTVYLE